MRRTQERVRGIVALGFLFWAMMLGGCASDTGSATNTTPADTKASTADKGTTGTTSDTKAVASNGDKTSSSDDVANPKTLRIGLIPTENNEEVKAAFQPMKDYLDKKLGTPVEVFTATDYSGVIEAMRSKKIDVAWFGPASYVLAEKEAGAEAFAVQVTDKGIPTYKSVIVVPGDSPAKSLKDLKGKRMAFVDPASTSGALIPTIEIKEQTGMMPQQFFSKLIYTGGHDACELAIKNRTVDAAADDDITYGKMLEKGIISKKSNRILLTSSPIPGSPLAYRSDLNPALKAKIKTLFTTAHKETKVSGDGKTIRYDPCTPALYAPIREKIDKLELKSEDILKKK